MAHAPTDNNEKKTAPKTISIVNDNSILNVIINKLSFVRRLLFFNNSYFEEWRRTRT
jgi:hypothetical protein